MSPLPYLFQAILMEGKPEQVRGWGLHVFILGRVLIILTCYLHVVVPSQVYALVGSEQKGQVLGGMVAAGAGKLIKFNLLLPVFHTFPLVNLEGFCFLTQGVFSERLQVQINYCC